MNTIEILQKWLNYSNYDPEQTTFNLLSAEYQLHRCNDNIKKISEYDPSGSLAILYAKNSFENLMKDVSVKVLDVVQNPEFLAEEKEMWNVFNSADVTAIETEILDRIDAIVERVANKKMIGERNRETEKVALFDSIVAVVEDLGNCREDLFLKGGSISPAKRISTNIHLFESLADCLLALEAANDGIYLCYINQGGTADGYFGFYIKSNGSILSVNERIDEAYPGQHKRSRNGRWTENKKYKLFPYDYIFSFADYDYKGYAKKHMIDEEKLAFFNLSPEVYMPLILAMVMLNTKYSNTNVSAMPIKYVDSLLPVNINNQLDSSKELMLINDSAIVTVNKEFKIDMTVEGVKNAEYASRFNKTGCFLEGENVFVKLYGDDFQLDTLSLLEMNKHLKLPSSSLPLSSATPNAEFIGTAERMEMIAYMNARNQLAEHIREKIFEEYKSFGERKAVTEWWKKILKEKREKIISLCVKKYFAVQNHQVKNMGNWSMRNGNSDEYLCYIDYQLDCKSSAPFGYNYFSPLSQLHYNSRGNWDGKYLCCITENLASVFFAFRFNDYKEIAEVVGEENVPKIVKGWARERRCYGNPLLSATDPVSDVGTPFERGECQKNRRYWTKENWHNYYFHNSKDFPDWLTKEPLMETIDISPVFDFDFMVGFSKRGFKEILKEYSSYC